MEAKVVKLIYHNMLKIFIHTTVINTYVANAYNGRALALVTETGLGNSLTDLFHFRVVDSTQLEVLWL